MKKIFLIGLAATAMLTSCSNDENIEMPAQNNAIGFSTFVNKSTRATESDDITKSNIKNIYVYGWRGDTQIFDAQEVAVDGTSGDGSYSPVQYWEAGYTYAFEAIAPKSGENGVTFTAAKEGGSITFVNDASTDLVYSKADDKVTESSLAATPGKVNFTFGHLLSRVKFTFTNAFPAEAVAKITVSNVKITNAYKNGTITPAAASAAWTLTDNTLNVAFENVDATDILAGNNTGATEHMYLLPAVTPSYNVEFDVTLDQAGATTTYHHTATITTTMEMGKSYNFVAKIDNTNIDPKNELYPIEFTADVTPWGEFNEPGTDLNL